MSTREGFAERGPEDLAYAGVVYAGTVKAIGAAERQYGPALFDIPRHVNAAAAEAVYAQAAESTTQLGSGAIGTMVEMEPGGYDLAA
jgi:hypothetical protein